MAIWRKNNLSSTSQEEEKKTRAPQLSKAREGKRKAIPDLNIPYNGTEENNNAEIVLPTKLSGCMVKSDEKTPEAVINVHKHTTLVVMGCVSCYMYVMVGKNHRICPKCGRGDYLIDFAAQVNANKKRAI